MVTLHDVKSGNSYEVKEGVTLQQVCEQYCQHGDMPIAAALYNNECVGLQTKVDQSGDVDWLPINTMEGNQCNRFSSQARSTIGLECFTKPV